MGSLFGDYPTHLAKAHASLPLGAAVKIFNRLNLL